MDISLSWSDVRNILADTAHVNTRIKGKLLKRLFQDGLMTASQYSEKKSCICGKYKWVKRGTRVNKNNQTVQEYRCSVCGKTKTQVVTK